LTRRALMRIRTLSLLFAEIIRVLRFTKEGTEKNYCKSNQLKTLCSLCGIHYFSIASAASFILSAAAPAAAASSTCAPASGAPAFMAASASACFSSENFTAASASSFVLLVVQISVVEAPSQNCVGGDYLAMITVIRLTA